MDENDNLNSIKDDKKKEKKHEYYLPWRKDEQYFEKYKDIINKDFPDGIPDVRFEHGGHIAIENYTEEQFEYMDRGMDNIDYYMYISFYFCYDTQKVWDDKNCKMVESESVEDKIDKYNIKFLVLSFYKLIPCIFIQLIVNPINIYYAVYNTSDLCKNENNIILKLVASIMALFLSVSSFTSIKTEVSKYSGSTFYFKYYYQKAREFNNRGIIYSKMMFCFFFLNMYSSLLTTIGTVFIIYNSEGVLEIVLNAVALKFIDEIDNITISKEEEAKFIKLYREIREDVMFFELDREYKSVTRTDPYGNNPITDEFKDNDTNRLFCAFFTCNMIVTIITPAIVLYSVIYLLICY